MDLLPRTFSNDECLVAQRRTSIVASSIKVFTKDGYHSTNMRELAKACGMSTGAIYHYFGSKEDILFMIIDTATHGQADIIENLAKELESIPTPEALDKLIGAHFRWHDEHQDVTLFVYQETKNLSKEARQRIFDSEMRIFEAFRSLLERGVKAGELDVDNCTLCAHNIIIIGHSWAIRRWFLRRLYTFEEFLNEQRDNILKSITKT